ncbi:BTAD domain-containing putative transcriptional regulator [Kitasatospora sp. NPDC093550]|uniref:AfsR/SARP family transcriptional regulator n=1 Tax=Kitasatospora sp. NPDC093550 TaxID=3364089 RepID=UPI0037F7501C
MVRIRLLGPVELRVGSDGFATPAGAQRRAILALLALELGRVVTVDRLCEALWGERSPASARAAVQGHVAALRKLLAGTPFELHTRSPGYLLAGPADEVDALRFETLTVRAAGHAERAEDAEDAEAIALLEEAQRLWRGEALADLPDTPLRTAVVDRLQQSRTAALLDWASLRLRQGTGAAAVAALEQEVRTDGLREELVALLMRCLRQAGRPADALTAYHRALRRLDGELGIRPGPALQTALAEVLADEPPEPSPAVPPAPGPAVHAPDQLPRRLVDFTGRQAELDRLDQACAPDRGTDGPVLVVGPAGVGKSALVTAWAHRAAHRFPDGRLYADLRGLAQDGQARPEAVLADFLHALGVPADAVPVGRAARAALFRERTRGRRLLVVLDDAAGPDQVGDLLPEGPDCAAVVTSRASLEDLIALDGAVLLRLAAPSEEDALLLLERALTPERVRADREAAGRVVRLCDRLPLALRIAAARLTAQPDWTVTELADELADERTRLAVLDAGGPLGIEAQLLLTHRQLSSTASELFTALAVHPGAEFDLTASAALLATDTATAHAALGELAAHHLLTGTAPGRYRHTGLVRLFGAGLLAELPEAARRLFRERLADYYLAALQHCGFYLDPCQEDSDSPAHPPHTLPAVGDIRAALDWFRAEEPAVRALVEAVTTTDPERAWRIALTTGSLYYGASLFSHWLDRATAGLAAAERCGDPGAIALLLNCRAQALIALERRREAADAARKAVGFTDTVDGPLATSARIRALATLALATAMLGDTTEAQRLAASATSLAVASGNRRRLVDAKIHQGAVGLASGDPDAARRHSREASDLLPPTPVTQVHLWALLTEAQSLPLTVREGAADLIWHRLLAACEEAGLLYGHALAEQSYAAYLVARGRAPEVSGRLRSALDRFRRHEQLAGYRSEFATSLEQSLNLRSPEWSPGR